jgi:Tol biopolymer transport system component
LSRYRVPAGYLGGGGEIVKSLIVVLGVLGALTLTHAAQQKPAAPVQTAEAALGAAIRFEEVERNLDAAIEAYRAIVARFSSNRPVAATALYRLARAYEIRGNAEAGRTYERVVKEFGDQKDVANDAAQRLAALRVVRNPDGLVTRFVLAAGAHYSALDVAISDDGRWLARRNPSLDDGDPSNNDGNLLVTELASGRVIRLPTGTCLQGSKGCRAERPIFSPDGRLIAYAWRDQLTADTELRVIANEPGAKFRPLVREQNISMRPLDWSGDGRSLLVIKEGTQAELISGEAGFALVSVSDGSHRMVKSTIGTETIELFLRAALSPDGRFIAYAATTGTSNGPALTVETQVRVVAVDGSREVELLTAEGINEHPMWTPDGRHIVFVSNRSGAFALWATPVREGKASGPAVLVRREAGRTMPFAITRGGSLYYVPYESGEGIRMFEVALDQASGKATGTRREISERFVGFNINAAWSPDGKWVAFKRQRPENQNIRDIVVRSEETKTERTYTAPDWVNTQFGFGPGAPDWLADGSGFFIGVEPIPGQTRWLGRMTLDGQFTRLVQIPPALGWVASLSPDNKTAYVFTRRGNSPTGVYAGVAAVDLLTGQSKKIFEAADGSRVFSADASPDGRALAVYIAAETSGRVTATTIATMSIDGSNYQEIYVGQPLDSTAPDHLQWAPDGRFLFFHEAGGLMRFELQGGAPEYVGLTRTGPDTRFWISPDGRRLAFNEGAQPTRLNEIWALDNVISALKTGR